MAVVTVVVTVAMAVVVTVAMAVAVTVPVVTAAAEICPTRPSCIGAESLRNRDQRNG